MIEAKTTRRKIVWAALILVSISMTCMSISKAVNNFLAETSHIVAEHLEIEDMVYPPLKACLTHWMLWVNWTTTQELNFTKSEVLYGLSFLQHAYSEESFDVGRVEESFFKKLKAKNMTLEHFFISIALKRRNILKSLEGESLDYEVVIQNYQLDPTWPPYYIMCYKFSADQMKQSVQKTFSNTLHDGSSLDTIVFFLFSNNLKATKKESAWLSSIEYDRLFNTRVIGQLWIMFNGYSKNGESVLTRQSKLVTMNPEVRQWKSTTDTPCQVGRNWIEGNTTCFEECREKFSLKSKKYYSSRQDIYFFDSSGDASWKIYERSAKSDHENLIDLNNINTSSAEVTALYEECVQNCRNEAGCTTWSYAISLLEMPRFDTRNLMIMYPSSVELMKEVDLQTWERFVAGVGGLLGIWSGASILTILQIVYCLFSQNRVHVAGDSHRN